MKYDVKCNDYEHQNSGPWTTVYNNVRALVMFFLAYNVSITGEKSYICSRTVKLNGQSKMFVHMLAMGHQWRCTHKYTFINFPIDNIAITKSSTTENNFMIIHLTLSLPHIITD